MLRLIGFVTLLYLAYWAGANDIGAGDAVDYVKQLWSSVVP